MAVHKTHVRTIAGGTPDMPKAPATSFVSCSCGYGVPEPDETYGDDIYDAAQMGRDLADSHAGRTKQAPLSPRNLGIVR